jgi:hypothetical protein
MGAWSQPGLLAMTVGSAVSIRANGGLSSFTTRSACSTRVRVRLATVQAQRRQPCPLSLIGHDMYGSRHDRGRYLVASLQSSRRTSTWWTRCPATARWLTGHAVGSDNHIVTCERDCSGRNCFVTSTWARPRRSRTSSGALRPRQAFVYTRPPSRGSCGSPSMRCRCPSLYPPRAGRASAHVHATGVPARRRSVMPAVCLPWDCAACPGTPSRRDQHPLGCADGSGSVSVSVGHVDREVLPRAGASMRGGIGRVLQPDLASARVRRRGRVRRSA